jgi:hypothetical protein
MTRSGALARPLGFFVLMLGFGLRLDTTWQALASTLLVLGAAGAVVGLAALGREQPRALSPGPAPGDNAAPARGGETGGTDCVPRSA